MCLVIVPAINTEAVPVPVQPGANRMSASALGVGLSF